MARVGHQAPDFQATALMPDGEFQDLHLQHFRGKYLVLFFYPLDFTFVCPTEIIAFSERYNEFKEINCELVACSIDSKFSHLAWTNTPRSEGGVGQLSIPMLADITKSISRDYGVLIEEEGIALRGLFIIDGTGKLRSMIVNDLPVGRSVDETLRLVKAFQFTDEHGEVCPAGWNPGAASIKTTKAGARSFFSATYGDGSSAAAAAAAAAPTPSSKKSKK